MKYFKLWLGEPSRLELMDKNQLSMILDDFAENNVGITASGIFTINYSFVGTVNRLKL